VASEEYVKQRFLDDPVKIQTYNFYEGNFYRGNSRTRSLERFTFEDIVIDMATHLKKQGYQNNPVVGEGDLLIVVHYGATDGEQSFMDLAGIDSLDDINSGGSGDFAALESIINISNSFHDANDLDRFDMAELLGLDDAFNESTPLYQREILEQSLTESRYFIVLMAYDFPLLKQGQIKLLWTTRYSIRALGQTFDKAIKDMNLVAGDYYGKNIDGLIKTRVVDGTSVKIGEIEVIEMIETEAEAEE